MFSTLKCVLFSVVASLVWYGSQRQVWGGGAWHLSGFGCPSWLGGVASGCGKCIYTMKKSYPLQLIYKVVI